MKKMKLYRQGDVLVEYFGDKLPEDVQKIASDKSRVVLAYGEVTGHAHALLSKTSTLYEWQGSRLLEITKATDLTHEEHAAITLAPGIYKVTQQREYSPEAIRNVAD
jgi:hypothetical protein